MVFILDSTSTTKLNSNVIYVTNEIRPQCIMYPILFKITFTIPCFVFYFFVANVSQIIRGIKATLSNSPHKFVSTT